MNLANREFARIARKEEDNMLQQFSQILNLPDIKTLMLKLIISNILNVVEIIRGQLYESKFYLMHESKFKLFEWRLTEYMQRLLAEKHYVDVHKFDDPSCLSIFKFLKDLNSLKTILREILNSSDRALATLEDCLRNFTIQKDLRREVANNTKELNNENKEFETYLGYNQNEERRREENFNNIIDNCMDEVLIIDPMKMRLRHNTLMAHNEDISTQVQKKLDALEKEISEYKYRLEMGLNIHEEVMTHQREQIEELKYKVAHWSKKYDEEYDKYTFENSNLKLTIIAMESNTETLQKRLLNFRMELARLGSISRNPMKKPKFKSHKSKVKHTKSEVEAAAKIRKHA